MSTNTLNIYVASSSTPKILATNLAFTRHLELYAKSSVFTRKSSDLLVLPPYDSISVHSIDGCNSGVSSQPFGDEVTRQGALNRLKELIKKEPNRDFYVSFEGGVTDSLLGGILNLSSDTFDCKQQLECFAWVAVAEGCTNRVSLARTASFILPPQVSNLVKGGLELGEADDKVFGRQGGKGLDGTVGKLTNGILNRAEYYAHALQLALIPFANDNLYESTI
jgi:inosine/xanthosine triphosphatase